ncbi:MAG: hydrogenase iron-sulfur subunit [Candidatus Thermoplasmatota archaeon]|nr:hydrogenase iron-sulfur subunit [Candidatus Thermoplasmatota archaeon]
MSKPVLVIGGGIAGIQASLDLAESGAKVVLVEKSPALGGKMAGLDKNFPTLDCSICIESPKISDVMRNRNVTVLTLSEVVKVDGQAGDFLVTVRESPRFVTDECTRCDLCVEACPQLTRNEFDSGMGARKAIYTPFSQAEPGKYVLDIETCLNEPPNYYPCQRCYDVCQPKAIDYSMITEDHLIHASAIIVATGFDLLNPELLKDFGYGTDPDVLTSYEFERLLSSAGPTEGDILKPSNMKMPESVLFVLCSGSRDRRIVEYCSRICCMYSVKEAMQASEHGVKKATALYIDVRAYGKGFDAFYQRTLDQGVRFVRGRPADIRRNKDLITVRYDSTSDGKLIQEDYDMVVLATATIPGRGTPELSRILGIELGEDGFFRTDEANPVETTRRGILVAGCASGPKDIPDSVTEASAAAASAMEFVAEREWIKEEVPEPLDTSGDPRVGVFLCDCGSNIAGVVNVKEVMNRATGIPGVAYVEENKFSCSGSTQDQIVRRIGEKKLNRVVVSACSPKTHGSTFQRACARAGLNPFLFEMANVRNMDSWVHRGEKEAATRKAVDMVGMAVAKARALAPLTEKEFPVTRRALVLGGGVAGLSAATALARMGIETHLVESSPSLGGMLNSLEELAPAGIRSREVLNRKVSEFNSSGAVAHLSTRVMVISGFVGNYQASLSDGSTMDLGAVVLATGANPYSPKEFGYGNDPRVITSLELEKRMDSLDAGSVSIISCVGSREKGRGCSRFCCSTMLGQALRLREKGKRVRVLYRDIRAYSRYAEDLYYKASKSGVQFFKYDSNENGESVELQEGVLTVRDDLSGETIGLKSDLVVLNVGMVPVDDPVFSQLKLSRDEEGFLLELHPKLGPVEAAVPGVFLAGTVQGPKDFRESSVQGLAAASKASGILLKDRMKKEPIIATIDAKKCTKCMQCEPACPYGAIKGERGKWIELNAAVCMGCGNCVSSCFVGAMSMPGFTDDQLIAQIDAATEEDPQEKVVTFACNWCSYAGADQAGISKIQYPPSSRVIRTMCSSRVSQKLVWRALERGAGAVLITGCHINDCHYISANEDTEKRIERWRKMLEGRGVNPDRLQLHWVSAAEGNRFAQKMREMDKFIRTLPEEEIAKGREAFLRRA